MPKNRLKRLSGSAGGAGSATFPRCAIACSDGLRISAGRGVGNGMLCTTRTGGACGACSAVFSGAVCANATGGSPNDRVESMKLMSKTGATSRLCFLGAFLGTAVTASAGAAGCAVTMVIAGAGRASSWCMPNRLA